MEIVKDLEGSSHYLSLMKIVLCMNLNMTALMLVVLELEGYVSHYVLGVYCERYLCGLCGVDGICGFRNFERNIKDRKCEVIGILLLPVSHCTRSTHSTSDWYTKRYLVPGCISN